VTEGEAGMVCVSLLNPVVTCGYVNTVHTVCYVVNKSFFLHMDSCQHVY